MEKEIAVLGSTPFDNPICKKCIEDYKTNHPNTKKFNIKCRGIITDISTLYGDEPVAGLSEEEVRLLEYAHNKPLWAEEILGWVPRSYQEKELLCSARRRILRWGRRCLEENEKVLMGDGSLKPIKDIKYGDMVLSKGSNSKLVSKRVLSAEVNGVQPVLKITLTNGKSINLTSNHPLLCRVPKEDGSKTYKNQWKSIDEGLKKGDKITIINEYQKFGTYNNEKEAALLGYLLSDGHIAKGQTPKFTSCTREYIEEIRSLCLDLFQYKCTVKKRSESRAFDIHLTDGDKGTRNKVSQWLANLEIDKPKEKMDRFLFLANMFDKDSLKLLLNRLWAGDGTVSIGLKKGKPFPTAECSLASRNKSFLEDLCQVLGKVGVDAKIKADKKRDTDGNLTYLNWKIYFADANSIEKFLWFTGPIFGKEKNSLEALRVAQLHKKRARPIVASNYRRVRIKDISLVGERNTYDIEVEDTHNFIVNNIISHNTGKSDTMCINALHEAIFNPQNFYPFIKIMFIVPGETQQTYIYDKLLELIGRSSDISGRITNRQKPYPTIEFFTNDKMIGKIAIFLTGASSSNEAQSMRGFGADIFIIDEAAYLNEGDYGTFMPMVNEPPGHDLWVSSTPKAMRDRFREFCEDDRFRMWHVPFTERTDLTPELYEDALKDARSEAKFRLEYMAEFSDSISSVYKSSDIDLALEDYKFEDLVGTIGSSPVYIGVDWNTRDTGDWIAVVTPTQDRKIMLIDLIRISSTDRTQVVALQKIVELNRTYNNVKGIYCDATPGGANVELLWHIGREARIKNSGHPNDKKLVDIVRGVSYPSIDIFDPTTRQYVKKHTKPYMVERSVTYMEEQRISIPRFLDDPDLLADQMRKYQIEKISPTTQMPVFSEGNQHALSSWHFAILAYDLEEEIFSHQGLSIVGLALANSEQKTGAIDTRTTSLTSVSRRGSAKRRNRQSENSRSSQLLGIGNSFSRKTFSVG